jgi:hypothetical protein
MIGMLQTVLAQPFGRFLLTAVALGFAAFGLFAISPVAVPPDVTQQYHVHGRYRLRCAALIIAFRAMRLAVAPTAMPSGGQSARFAMTAGGSPEQSPGLRR